MAILDLDPVDSPVLAMPPRPARPLFSPRLLATYPENSLAVCDDPLFDELIVERRYIFGRVVVISDPDGIKRVLQDNPDGYHRLSPLRRAFSFSAGRGMVCLEGEDWWRHRRVINPALDYRALRPDLPRMVQAAEQMAGLLGKIPPGQPVEIGRTLVHFVTRTTGQVFAGDTPQFDQMLLRMGRYPEKLNILDVLPLPAGLSFVERYRPSRAGIADYYPLLDRLIGERRRAGYTGGKDLLWRLANSRDRRTGQALSLDELRDEVLTLAAGYQTPVRPMSWMLYLLALHPTIEARVQAELDGVLGGRPPTPEDLPKLVYLRQVLDETMRLYAPLPAMLRRAVADDDVCGHRIPRRTIVAIMPWIVHRHRRLWDEPDRFDPERFAPERAEARPRCSFIPFGVGPHVCVAASLSMLQMQCALAALLGRFRFRLVPGQKIEPIAWTTLRPRGGIMMTIEPRRRSGDGLTSAPAS